MSKHHRAETDDKESGELFFLNSRDRPIMIWGNNKCINTGWLHPPPLTDRWMQKSNDSVRITIRTRAIEDILSKFQTCKYAVGSFHFQV